MFIPSLIRLLLPSLLLPPTPSPPPPPRSDPHLSFSPQVAFAHHPTDLSSLLVSSARRPTSALAAQTPLTLKTRKVKVYKPRSKQGYQAARFARQAEVTEEMWGGWEGVDVEAPGQSRSTRSVMLTWQATVRGSDAQLTLRRAALDVEDRATLVSLAKMTSDA